MLFIRGREHFALVDVIHFQRFEHLRFREVADAHFGHHRNRNRVHNFANDTRRRHARHSAFLADVRRDALQRHHGARAGVLGDLGLLGVGHVHNHATLQHLRQPHFYTPQIIVHQFHRVSPSVLLANSLGASFVAACWVWRFGSTITNRPLPRARTCPETFRISPTISKFRPVISVSCPSTTKSASTGTGFRYSMLSSAVTACTPRNRQTLPITSSNTVAMIPP